MTLETVAWIVGVRLGTMHESQAEWAKKIKGKIRIRRIYQARQVIFLVLYENLGVSYREIGLMTNRPYESLIYRAIKAARDWVASSPKNRAIYDAINTDVRAAIEAEQDHHARTTGLTISRST